MKSLSVLLAGLLMFAFSAMGQYTPLPALDEAKYERFVAALRLEADQQNLPELREIADEMDYQEARRFLANPQVFADKLKNKTNQHADRAISAVRLGLIVAILLNHFTNLDEDWESSPRVGYALGLYAMFALGNLYFLTELLYTYRSAGEELAALDYKQYINLSFITLYTALLYAIQLEAIKWFIGAGPLLSIGISGKEKFEDGNNSFENDVEWGDGGIRRFQAGISLVTGFLLSRGMMLYLSYSFYFTKLFDGNSDYRMNMLKLAWGIPLNNGRSAGTMEQRLPAW